MHPLLTVVQGLSVEDGLELLQHIRSLARGSAVGVSGLIEDQSNLMALDGRGTIALSHVTTVDVVVDADNPNIRSAASGALQAEIDQLQRQSDMDAAMVEEIRAQLDPTVKSRLARLRHELHALMNGEDLSLERRQRVELALRQANDVDRFIVGSPDGTQEAIDAWESYQSYLAEHSAHVTALSQALAAADAEVDARRAGFSEAEVDAVPVKLTSAEETRLYDLEEMREQKNWRVDSAEAQELQQILAKVGVSSWTAYSMQRLSPVAAPEKLERVESAKAALSAQERERSEVRKELDGDPIVGELERLRGSAMSMAQRVLGAENELPENIGTGLRELEESHVNPEWVEVQMALLTVLKTPGISAPDDLNSEAAREWATAWLNNDTPAEDERGNDQVRKEIVVAEKALGRHNRALEQMDRLESRANVSIGQISRISEARKAAEAEGAHHTAELLSYIRALSEEGLWEASRPIPIAVTGELNKIDAAELMASLELLSQKVQVVVVTENPVVAEWAQTAGANRALLTSPTSAEIGSN